jgi:hypothetical protein
VVLPGVRKKGAPVNGACALTLAPTSTKYPERVTRSEHPIDIDDLLASCRAENAKRAFAEAVASFKAGAYRACIVVTWTAVVFDYVGKLRELELAGNGEAAKALVEWETARRNSDFALAMRLEDQMLSEAETRFDLLTPLERQDLERLHLDRHRCAHPSLLTLDEPYQPSAELARLHMRHAVGHLLSCPPVQGKEAWDRVWADVSSEYFPDEREAAAERLHAVLSRARPTLVRKLAIELARRILSKAESTGHARSRAALLGIMKLHHTELDALLREKLGSLAERVPDEDLTLLLSLCRYVEIAWGALGAPAQGRLRIFIERTDAMGSLADAWEVPVLSEVAMSRLASLDDSALVALACVSKRLEALEEIVRRFEASSSFTQIRDLREALGEDDLRNLWTVALKKRLVAALATNRHVQQYMGYPGAVERVLKLSGTTLDELREEWRSLYDGLLVSQRWLAEKIRAAYRDFPPPLQGSAS